MKRGIWLILLTLAVINSAHGLSVELAFPVENAVYVDSNTVVFRCKATGSDLRFIELYTNINGWSKKAEASNPQDNTEVIFSVKNISNGNYIWNCKAIDGTEGIKFSQNNRTFSVNLAPNTPPNYNNALTAQSWNINSQKNNAFDLDNFFSDPDGDSLTYSVNGNANINVVIDQNNIISFSQPTNWFGTEKVYFTANDGQHSTNSNYINLTVIKTDSSAPGNTSQNPPTTNPGSNTPPKIETKIPDQNKSADGGVWFMDLINYGKDEQDAESKLTWSVDGVSEDLLKIEIDNTNKRVKFSPQGKIGVDTVSFTVYDTGNLNTSQSIKVYLYKKETSLDQSLEEFSEEFKENKDIQNLQITSYSPKENEVSLAPDNPLMFAIETNVKGDAEWYVNGEKTGETKTNFKFNSKSEGIYNLTVYLSDLINTVSNTWIINIKSKTIEVKAEVKEPICGNNIAEENENCANCKEDIKCKKNEICENTICKEKSLGLLSITGNFINSLKTPQELSLINISVIISSIMLMIIMFVIIRTRKKNKLKYSKYLKEDSKKLGFFKRMRKKLRNREIEKQKNKQEQISKIQLEREKTNEITNLAPGLSHITSFIKENLEKGHTKRTIKKALKEKGWTRLQLWRAFRKA